MGMESFNDPSLNEIARDYKKEQDAIAEREKTRHQEIDASIQDKDEGQLTIEPQKTPDGYIEINSEKQFRNYEKLRNENGGGYVNENGEFVRGADAPDREKLTKNFDSFESFYKDSVAKNLLEKISLEYLKTKDKVYFDREYTGELDNEGYLIRKDGNKSGIYPGAEPRSSRARFARTCPPQRGGVLNPYIALLGSEIKVITLLFRSLYVGNKANTKPSMNITGDGMKWVYDRVKAELG